MTDDQKDIIVTLNWLSLASLLLLICTFMLNNAAALSPLVRGDADSGADNNNRGDDEKQQLENSTITFRELHQAPIYIPLVYAPDIIQPLFCCDTANIPEHYLHHLQLETEYVDFKV